MSKNDRRSSAAAFLALGAFNTLVKDGRLIGVEPFEKDPFPSRIIESMPDTLYAETRIKQPMVRASWLRKGPAPAPTSAAPSLSCRWPGTRPLDLVAGEVKRVRDEFGNASIFGGFLRLSSRRALPPCQDPVQRFPRMAGGFTAQVNTYSNAAGGVILPHIFGDRGMSRGPYTTGTAWKAYRPVRLLRRHRAEEHAGRSPAHGRARGP